MTAKLTRREAECEYDDSRTFLQSLVMRSRDDHAEARLRLKLVLLLQRSKAYDLRSTRDALDKLAMQGKKRMSFERALVYGRVRPRHTCVYVVS